MLDIPQSTLTVLNNKVKITNLVDIMEFLYLPTGFISPHKISNSKCLTMKFFFTWVVCQLKNKLHFKSLLPSIFHLKWFP